LSATWVTKVLAVVGAVALGGAAVAGVLAASVVRRGFSARDEPSWLEARMARTARGLATPERVRELRNPVAKTDAVVAEARAHWADHCATCHGNDGSGDTELGRNLYPRAPDMRTQATQSLSDGELYSVIENGVRLTGMPAWGHGGDDDEATWKLVHFIRHLPSATSEELGEMRQLNPRSPEEIRQQLEEEQFLQGGRGDAP